MTVFVIQEASQNANGWKPNLEPAFKYGPIKFLLPPNLDLSQNTGKVISYLEGMFQGFNPENDFIVDLVLGHVDPLGQQLIAIVLSRMGDELGWQYYQTLRWHRSKEKNGSGFYLPVKIMLN